MCDVFATRGMDEMGNRVETGLREQAAEVHRA
jgi:hypothetical protein